MTRSRYFVIIPGASGNSKDKLFRQSVCPTGPAVRRGKRHAKPNPNVVFKLISPGLSQATTHRFCPSPRTCMSAIPSTSISHSNFEFNFNTALETYRRKTKKDLTSHPLLPRLQSCDSPEAILTVLREQINGLNQSQNGDDGLTKWVTPTVNVLYAFSATLGQGVGQVIIGTFLREGLRL